MIELQQPIPIGTVVNVKGTPVDLMIVSQYPVTTINGVDGYFEFGAVALPLASQRSPIGDSPKPTILECQLRPPTQV